MPGTFVMGLMFPITIKAYQASSKDSETPEATVGKLYLFNTLGTIAGSLEAVELKLFCMLFWCNHFFRIGGLWYA